MPRGDWDDWIPEEEEITQLRAAELALSKSKLCEHLKRITARREAWEGFKARQKAIYRRINEDEVDEWVLQSAGGMAIKEIAEASGVSWGSVYEHLRKRARENSGE